jgi:hypothetical protein
MRWWLGLLSPGLAWGQSVELTHQGRLLDSAGAPVQGAVNLTVAVMDAASGGNVVHTETFSALTPADGYYAVTLGASGGLEAHELDGARWLAVSVNGSEMPPRSRLQSTPRAAVSYRAAQSASAPFTCDAPAEEGAIYYDTTLDRLRFCAPSGWQDVGSGASSGALLGTSTNPAENCQQIHLADLGRASGSYWVDPDGAGFGVNPFQVYCDMDTDNGGWTLVRVDDHTDKSSIKSAGAVGAVPATRTCAGANVKFSDAVIRDLWSSQMRYTVQADAAGDMTYFSNTVLTSLTSFSDRCGNSNVIKWFFKRAPTVLSGDGNHGEYCGWSYGPCGGGQFCWYGPHGGYKVHMNSGGAHISVPSGIASMGVEQGCGMGWVR